MSEEPAMLEEKTRADLVARLEADLARLEADVDELMRSQAESLSDASGESAFRDHMGDQGTAALEREMDMTLEENERDALDLVRAALDRVKAGTYGVCSRCGSDIPTGRLEAMPTATMCITCQEAEETR
jgi:DnaK suppressor protein